MFNQLSNEEIQRVAPSAFAGQAYSKTSDRYAFVPTSSVIDAMRSAGFMPVKAQQSRTRIEEKRNFTKHMIRFRPENVAMSTVGDSSLEIVLVNSHDGTSRYELSAGVFRLVCTNGMLVSDGLIGSVKIKHMGDVIERVIESSNKLLADAPKVAETIGKWRTIDLNFQEQLALAEAAHTVRFDEDSTLAAAIQPESLLASRRYADNGTDLWSTMNRIQENVIKGNVRGRTAGFRRVKSRAVNGIDADVRLNKAIWTLAAKVAEIKQA